MTREEQRSPRPIEQGTKFGRLTATGNTKFVAAFSRYKGKMRNQTFWEFTCECTPDVHVWKQASSIKTGAVISCGNGCWRFKTHAVQHAVYAGYRTDARRRDLPFDISFADAVAFFDLNCTYCDSPPSNTRRVKSYVITFNGIDRIDTTKGYSKDNCVPCCKRCNYAKHVMSTPVFLEHVEKIYKHSIANT